FHVVAHVADAPTFHDRTTVFPWRITTVPDTGSLAVHDRRVAARAPSPSGENTAVVAAAAIDGAVVSTVSVNVRRAWLPASSATTRIARVRAAGTPGP